MHRGHDGSLDGGPSVYAKGGVIVPGSADRLIRLELEDAVWRAGPCRGGVRELRC